MKIKFFVKAKAGFLPVASGLLAISLSGLFLGGFASADDPADVVDGDNSATSSTLDTQEKCTWFVTGVPASVTMIIDPDETMSKYDGTEMDLESETPDALTAYTSGNEGTGTAGANTECTFYNDKTGISISKSIDTYVFSATKEGAESAEAGMGFTLSVSNSLSITYVEGICWSSADSDESPSGWTVGNANLYNGENTTSQVLSLPFDSTAQVNTTEISERCTLSGTYAVSVPAGKQPSFPNSNYEFTGPTISTDITLPNT
jgi:hypothetical protein